MDHEVDVLITVRCGQNAAEVFQEAGMKIYQSVNKAAADDLKAMEEAGMKIYQSVNKAAADDLKAMEEGPGSSQSGGDGGNCYIH